MSSGSSIEWTQSTWNPVTGCTKISPGCKNCYAERMARRLQAMGQKNYAHGFKLTAHDSALELPLLWKTPQTIFVNSMSDLFHKSVPVEFILRVFDVMHRAHWHQFQVLTKRAERLESIDSQLQWSENIWMGVSVESQEYISRIDHLRNTGAKTKFISFEPLLGEIDSVSLEGIDWVIVGGESGPGARPISESWVLRLRDLCQERRIPFFFKQWGGVRKRQAGRHLDGRLWNQWPVIPCASSSSSL